MSTSSDVAGSSVRINLTSPSHVRALLAELGVHPNRALGQNFLVDRNILDILIAASEVCAGETVLEIGPGLGVVAEALLARGAWVVAVEKDHRLVSHLRGRFAGCERFLLLQGDMLDVQLQWAREGCPPAVESASGSRPARVFLPPPSYRVVSNLPYSSGSRILATFVRCACPPHAMTVTVQSEVAARICAAPVGRDYGLLSAWIGLRYDAAVTKRISPSCFWPRPEVSSSIVTLHARSRPLLASEHEDAYFNVIKRCFAQRRKQLTTTLRSFPEAKTWSLGPNALLERAGIPPTARPQDVSVPQWCELVRAQRSIAVTEERGNHG